MSLSPEQRAEVEYVRETIRKLEAAGRRDREDEARKALAEVDDQRPATMHVRRRRFGTIRFVAATSTESGRVRLDMSGADLSSFRKNPAVVWRHRTDLFPVGRVTDLFVEDDQLIADVRFDRRDPLGREVGRRYRRRFLHAVSIQYLPLDYGVGDDGVLVVSRWRLVELSCCVLPADRNAVREDAKAPTPIEALRMLRDKVR